MSFNKFSMLNVSSFSKTGTDSEKFSFKVADPTGLRDVVMHVYWLCLYIDV